MILIAEARFYTDIADSLANAAIAALERAKAGYERIEVPGSFELPAAISFAAQSGRYNGFIALGCVLRGETSHYDIVCNEVARGIQELAVNRGLALGFGVITAENEDQAWVRAKAEGENYGGRAAEACLRMIALKSKFKG